MLNVNNTFNRIFISHLPHIEEFFYHHKSKSFKDHMMYSQIGYHKDNKMLREKIN